MKHRIAVLASGNGTNAEHLARYFAHSPVAEVALILTNRREAFVLERARSLNIPAFYYPKSDWEAGTPIIYILRQYDIDFVVLAGFLLRIPSLLLQAYPDRMVNIHPSLLPRHGGQGMYGDRVHESVLAAGDAESGITIHYTNEAYDEGAIIFQATCPVLPGDTPHALAQRVHALEYQHYPEVIARLLSD
jgi:phosphoribosylglycinamide formyltransferase-1